MTPPGQLRSSDQPLLELTTVRTLSNLEDPDPRQLLVPGPIKLQIKRDLTVAATDSISQELLRNRNSLRKHLTHRRHHVNSV